MYPEQIKTKLPAMNRLIQKMTYQKLDKLQSNERLSGARRALDDRQLGV
jgi:hypothetical protein